MNLHEVNVDEEGLAGFRRRVEKVESIFLDILVEKGNADDAFVGCVDVLAVDLEILAWFLAGISRHGAFGDFVEHVSQF